MKSGDFMAYILIAHLDLGMDGGTQDSFFFHIFREEDVQMIGGKGLSGMAEDAGNKFVPREIFHGRNTAADEDVMRVQNVDFGGHSHGHAVQELLKQRMLAVFGEKIGDGDIWEHRFLQLHQIFSAGNGFHTAGIATAAGQIAAVYGDVTQFSGSSVFSNQGNAVDGNGIPNTGSEIEAADNAGIWDSVMLTVVMKGHGDIPLYEDWQNKFLG